MLSYFVTISLFRYYLHLEKDMALFEQTWIPITQGCFVPGLVESGPVVLEKDLNFRQCIFAFLYHLPLEMGVTLHFNKLKSLLTKDALCQVWLKLGL